MSRQLSGIGAWLVQRLSAVYMTVFLILFAALFWSVPVVHYRGWYQLVAQSAVAIGGVLFFIALLFHCWVGIRDVILDYVSPLGLRLVLLALLGGWLLALAVWAVRIFLQITL